MLREALSWLTTPCVQPARRYGYLHELIATAARARRCRAAWENHQRRSRDIILAHATGGACLRLLGAGYLGDVPLDILAARYDRIELVDWVFLRETRRQVRRYSHVSLLETDITGIIPALLQAPSFAAIERLLASEEPDDGKADQTVSLNLITQLPLLPLQYLDRRFPKLAEERLNAWGLRLMQRHLDRLRHHGGLLIADLHQAEYDREGNLLHSRDYLHHFNLSPERIANWSWPAAPAGELPHGQYTRHQVSACYWPKSATLNYAHQNTA